MEQFSRGKSAIVGAATYGIGQAPGMTSLDLAARAALLALDDAGLKLPDVDALFVCTPDDALSGLSAAEYLGIQPRFTENNRTGGSAFFSHAIVAALMLEAGYCENALIMYGSNQRTSSGGLMSMRRASKRWRRKSLHSARWSIKWTPTAPGSIVWARCFRRVGSLPFCSRSW